MGFRLSHPGQTPRRRRRWRRTPKTTRRDWSSPGNRLRAKRKETPTDTALRDVQTDRGTGWQTNRPRMRDGENATGPQCSLYVTSDCGAEPSGSCLPTTTSIYNYTTHLSQPAATAGSPELSYSANVRERCLRILFPIALLKRFRHASGLPCLFSLSVIGNFGNSAAIAAANHFPESFLTVMSACDDE